MSISLKAYFVVKLSTKIFKNSDYEWARFVLHRLSWWSWIKGETCGCGYMFILITLRKTWVGKSITLSVEKFHKCIWLVRFELIIQFQAGFVACKDLPNSVVPVMLKGKEIRYSKGIEDWVGMHTIDHKLIRVLNLTQI